MKRAAALLSVLAIPSCFAQQAISVKSGLIHYVEGQVKLAGAPLKQEFGKFPTLHENMVLDTERGRAELLLTPGAFLRLGDKSSLKMLSTSLSDTRVEISGGAALVEVVEMAKENHVAIRVGESETVLDRPGLFLFDADAGRVRTFDGKATVRVGDETLVLGKGRQTSTSKALATKFNLKETEADALYAWSESRAAMVAQANVYAANSYRRSGSGYSTLGTGWYWYPGMGLMTFLPRAGYFRSGFGWYFYSPATVWRYYAPRYDQQQQQSGLDAYRGGMNRPSWSGSGGSASNSSMGVSSVGMSSGRAASAPAASAPVSAPAGGRSR